MLGSMRTRHFGQMGVVFRLSLTIVDHLPSRTVVLLLPLPQFDQPRLPLVFVQPGALEGHDVGRQAPVDLPAVDAGVVVPL